MNEGVGKYIEKQKSPQKEIIKKVRKIIMKTLPGVKEEMRWGVPVFADKFYLGALKDHVNIGFSIKGLSKKEQQLFEGSGKTMRHIKVNSLKDIDEKRIVKLLKLVQKRSRPCTGCG